MKLEDILKSKGWTDADIAGLAPMLTNERFRADLEAQYGAVVSERDGLKAKDEAWQRQLDEQWNPRVASLEKEAQDARVEAAQLKEYVKIAKDYGYLSPEALAKADAAAAAAAPKPADPATYDAKRHPSWDDITKLADAEGDAIAIANDLNSEYAYLTGGKSLFEYQTEINGVPVRGMRALRAEAKANRKTIDQYVAEKFNFNVLREQMRQKQQQEHDSKIVKETEERIRGEFAAKYANPNMAYPVPSRAPFIPPKADGGKQPWEIPAQERRANRIQKFMKTQMEHPGSVM